MPGMRLGGDLDGRADAAWMDYEAAQLVFLANVTSVTRTPSKQLRLFLRIRR